MLKKQRVKKNNITKVTFVLAPDIEGDTVHLAGEFNEWQTSQAMKKQNDDRWRLTLNLESDGEYQFRYLLDEQEWFNDPEADSYITNPFGGQNSVVIT